MRIRDIEPKSGYFNGEDPHYTSEVIGEVDRIMRAADISPGHQPMVGASIGETLSHLAVENIGALYQLGARDEYGNVAADAPASIIDALDRLQADEATTFDRLRILQSDFRPLVRSLELARCHHFLQNNSDEEGRMIWLVREGMALFDPSAEYNPELYKMKIHDHHIDESGEVDGAIVSIKEDVYKGEDVGVRHRRKAFLKTADIEELIQPYDWHGGSFEEQKIHLQRQLRRPHGSYIPISSLIADSIKQCIDSHPESLLTSIYYGFRPDVKDTDESGRPHIGGVALGSTVAIN